MASSATLHSARNRTSEARTRHFAAYDLPILALLLGLSGVTLLSLARSGLPALTHSATVDVCMNTAMLLIALAAAYFAFAEFLLYGLIASLCVGLAFLTFAESDVGMTLIPVLAGATHRLSLVPYGVATLRMVGGVFLLAASILVDGRVPILRRRRLIAVGFILTVLLCAIATITVYTTPVTGASKAAEALLQLAAGQLFFLAGVLFWRASKAMGRTWFLWLSFNLAIAGFAQLEYAVHWYPVGVVQPGDVLRFVFFSGILLALAAEWNQDYRRLRWQARELEALHALLTAPVIEDAPAVVQHIVRIVGESLDAHARIVVSGQEENGGRDPLTTQLRHLDEATPAGAESVEARPIAVSVEEGSSLQVALAVPLRTAERKLGVLLVVRDGEDEFSPQDVRLLRAFGAQASVLLERSLLYQEVAAGAVVAERSRLAREIHDGLAQHLAYLKMRAAWLQRSPGPLDPSQLEDIQGGLETALAEARQAITTLRAEVHGTSTVDSIISYAEEFGVVSGLDVRVIQAEGAPEVGPKARLELLRVVQEALNNIRKHAQATSVVLDIRPEGGGLAVSIRDDGVGYAADQSLRGHFGMEIMRERAESIGGRLEVSSVVGAGTTVRISVPSPGAEAELGDLRLA